MNFKNIWLLLIVSLLAVSLGACTPEIRAASVTCEEVQITSVLDSHDEVVGTVRSPTLTSEYRYEYDDDFKHYSYYRYQTNRDVWRQYVEEINEGIREVNEQLLFLYVNPQMLFERSTDMSHWIDGTAGGLTEASCPDEEVSRTVYLQLSFYDDFRYTETNIEDGVAYVTVRPFLEEATTFVGYSFPSSILDQIMESSFSGGWNSFETSPVFDEGLTTTPWELKDLIVLTTHKQGVSFILSSEDYAGLYPAIVKGLEVTGTRESDMPVKMILQGETYDGNYVFANVFVKDENLVVHGWAAPNIRFSEGIIAINSLENVKTGVIYILNPKSK